MTRNAFVAAKLSAVIAFGFMGYACSSDNGNGGDGGGQGGGGGDSSVPDAGHDGTTTGSEGGASEAGRDGTSGGTDSGSPDSGHDGATGAGDGSMSGGDGGTTDASDGGSAEAGIPACSAGFLDAGVCSGNASCTERCGVDVSMLTLTPTRRTCTCSGAADAGDAGARWSCPSAAGSCVYPTDVDLSCMQLPDGGLPACSLDMGDGGSGDAGPGDGGGGLVRSGVSPCMLPNSETCGNVCGSASPTVASYLDSTDAGKSGYCVCVVGTWQCASVNDWPKF